MEMYAARRAMMALAMVGFLQGCGSGIHYEHAKVHGTVTYQGKPVTQGTVLFVPVEPPKDGAVQPASGNLDANGNYELKSENDSGAILGEHKVVVFSMEGTGSQPATEKKEEKDAGAAPSPKGPARSARLKSLVPKKYSDPSTTPLTRKVVAGDNKIDLELTD